MKKSILKAMHNAAKGLHKVGLVSKHTLREFDILCLPPVREFSPSAIKRLREKERVSQPIFAACLNISSSTIKKWESGEKHPHGASLKLLNLVAKKGLQGLL